MSSPLYVACNSGQVDIVKALIAAKADINSKNGVDPKAAQKVLEEETPLYKASFLGNDAIVAVLIEAKADVNLCRKSVQARGSCTWNSPYLCRKSQSPLYIASRGATQAHLGIVVRRLIPANADVNFRDRCTIFSLCKSVAFIKYVQFLFVF